MNRLSNIPAEIRWDIATRCADAIPFAYDKAIREIAGEKTDEIQKAEEKIWHSIGKTQGRVAKELGYTISSALDVAQAVNELSVIMFGPDMKGEVKTGAGDSAVTIIRRCPLAGNTKRFKKDPGESCSLCSAFFVSAGESLSRDYTVIFEKHMCTGDSFCEMKVLRK